MDCKSTKFFSIIAWLLKDYMTFACLRNIFCYNLNHCLHVTSVCYSTSTFHKPYTLVMNPRNIQDCQAFIYQHSGSEEACQRLPFRLSNMIIVKFAIIIIPVNFWLYFSSLIHFRLELVLQCLDYIRFYLPKS